MKLRLDHEMVARQMVNSRSQAESYIRLGKVLVDGKVQNKSGYFVNTGAKIKLEQENQYVSRAGMKLESVARGLKLDFTDKVVLDVGSSTGGFTDFALRNGAKKVIAVEVGTDQLHPSLRGNEKIELHEKTDIRDFTTGQKIDIVVADVSFISLTEILPSVAKLCNENTILAMMVKPQFEAGYKQTVNGVVKNDKQRREILKNFEIWTRNNGFFILNKMDSEIAGANGNRERFYLLKLEK